jgi:hypothetical protein
MRRLPPKYDPKPTQSEGETSDPLIADRRNFYKVGLSFIPRLVAGVPQPSLGRSSESPQRPAHPAK